MAKASFLLLSGLAACATTPSPTNGLATARSPAESLLNVRPLPMAAPVASANEGPAPNDTTLPVGIGMTFGPSAPMIGAALDFPLDKQITFGPSLQYAGEDDLTLISATAQLKYFPLLDDKKPKFQPYATIGAGFVSLDKEGRSGDTGGVIDFGGGVRILTGDHYSIGSELRWNWLPDDIGGEDSYLSLELIQVVITF